MRRIAGFALIPAVAALTPLLVIPALTHRMGAAGWAAVATGQAVGAFANLIVLYGWLATGPTTLPGLSHSARQRQYRLSILVRVVIAVPTLPLAAIAAYFASQAAYPAVAAGTAVAFGIWGLSPTWYYIGIGKARRVALFDTMPKILAAVATIVWLSYSTAPLAYAITYGVAGIVASALAARSISAGSGWPTIVEVKSNLVENLPVAAARLVGSGFTTLSIPLVAIAHPAAVPAFAAVERIRGFMWLAINAVSSAVQGWIGEAMDPHSARPRQRTALRLTVLSGLLAGVAVSFGLPMIAGHLFSHSVKVGWILALVAGSTMLAVAASMSFTFHFLGPAGRGKPIFYAAIAGSVVGVPLLLVLPTHLGPVGGSLGVMAAETVGAVILYRSARRLAMTSSASRGVHDVTV